MELIIKDTQGVLKVSKAVFNCNFNKSLVHQVVVAYAAGARQGTRAQKNRSEVSGSSKKPWRQKGTGRARAGSVKSPIWRSGGTTFAAKPQDHSQKVNKKMYRGAIRSIISELLRQDRIIIIEKFILKEPKTKLLVYELQQMNLAIDKDNVLIITNDFDRNLFLAARNLPKLDICNVLNINPISLINFKKTIMVGNVIKQIEERMIR